MINKPFRLNAKKLYLTYSQIDKNITHGELLNIFNNLLNINEYLIALENHKDGGLHAHLYFILNKRCDFRSSKCLDFMYNNKIFHGNYQTAKHHNALITYMAKDNNYITNMTFHIHNNKIITCEEFLLYESRRVGINKALNNFIEMYPNKAIKNINNLISNLKTCELIHELNQIKTDDVENTLDNFNFNALENKEELFKWINSQKKKSLILCGKSNTGKSFLGKTLIKLLTKDNYLRVTDYQGLKNLDNTHKGILFDDVKLADLPETTIINLLDTLDRNDLRLLHHVKSKNPDLIQIFTINDLRTLFKTLPEQLSRRALVIHFDKTIVNITVNNIQNNNFYLNDKKHLDNNNIIWQKFQSIKNTPEGDSP